jgi:serine/threonine protein kinase
VQAPPILAGYEVIGRLGKGRAVWLAEETVSGLRGLVAVRIGRPEAPEGLLLREIMGLSHVRSPHVAAYRHCLRTADGACAVVTEYIAGESLAAVLASRPDGRLPWRPPPADPGGAEPSGGVGAASVIMGVLIGLAALHTAQPPIVHRRVTPSNIIIVGGTAVITDLRLSALASGPASQAGGPPAPLGALPGGAAGTSGYMSPELAEGAVGLDGLDARADVWAAGVVLHEALSGERLFPQAGAPIPLTRARVSTLVAVHQRAWAGALCVGTRRRRIGGRSAGRGCGVG